MADVIQNVNFVHSRKHITPTNFLTVVYYHIGHTYHLFIYT